MNSDMLSQEEIDALLNDDTSEGNDNNIMLTNEEMDALGEIGNISMGTAATTLFTLLGQKVLITTPKVSITNMEQLSKEYPSPYVAVDVKYKVGLEGTNLLILKTDDVKTITDLMMGRDGTNINRDLNDMDLSAISEAMNQMVGSSSTSLSEMFSKKIDIDPPKAFEIKFDDNTDEINAFKNEGDLVKVSFKMEVGDLIDSEIMQLIPLEFAKDLVTNLFDNEVEIDDITSDDTYDVESFDNEIESNANAYEEISVSSVERNYDHEENNSKQNVKKGVNVQKYDFQNFDKNNGIKYNENIDLIQDVPIEITAELGRTTRKISEVLEYGPGTIIELDKLVGEPLNILANGRVIAKGEVVVIDDNFGIRITDIVNPSKRLRKL